MIFIRHVAKIESGWRLGEGHGGGTCGMRCASVAAGYDTGLAKLAWRPPFY